MGVDATLFVLAPFGTERTGFVEHTFRLQRERVLWGPLRAVMSKRRIHRVQLPHGTHSRCTEQHEPACGCEEMGWLHEDSYGEPLKARKGRSLAALNPGSELNKKILSFVSETFPDHDVMVFWS